MVPLTLGSTMMPSTLVPQIVPLDRVTNEGATPTMGSQTVANQIDVESKKREIREYRKVLKQQNSSMSSDEFANGNRAKNMNK
jgi:hypothetical protein